MSPFYYVALLLLLCVCGFTSSAEMAFASANRVRLEHQAEEGVKAARIACRVYDRYDEMLSSILILNDLGNVLVSSLTSVIAINIAAAAGVDQGLIGIAATILTTLVIIIFCETIPKITAKKQANRLSVRYAYAVAFLMIILFPVVFIATGLTRLLTKPFKGEREGDKDAAADELASIIETVEGEGVIDNDRSELLRSALDFSDISVSEVMTSRVDMLSIDIDDEPEETAGIIDASPYSRLPVYEDSIDNIIGVLYLNYYYKALSTFGECDIRSVMLKPCYVYKTVKLPAVLSEMRRSRTQIAIVTDEYGGSMGIVSMEDVLEELVGDIWDETDEVEQEVVQHAEGLYEIDGDMTIGDFLELLETDEDDFETESSTVGGWTIEMLGHFPTRGEVFRYRDLLVTVLAVKGQRVEKVLVKVEKDDPPRPYE